MKDGVRAEINYYLAFFAWDPLGAFAAATIFFPIAINGAGVELIQRCAR
jgi:hypothetical protein